MKIQITRKPIHPQAGMRKQALHTITLAALLFTFLLPSRLLSQAEPSALMELQSTDKGFLLPRMTQAQRDAIQSPASGLMIYNTSANCIQINYGSPSAPSWYPIGCSGTVGALNCSNVNITGTLTSGQTASGVSASVPYTGGDGGSHNGQTVNSTGVAGLTATLAAGSFANGSGSLIYTITGTASSSGTASFSVSIGGQSCTLSVTVGSGTTSTCGAYVAPNQWKAFMCHNLGAANTSADPFTPSWEIIGGYWQWGRLGPGSSQWMDTNTPNFAHGPTGSGSTQANSGVISGWDTTPASSSAWLDGSKTANDPCPQGFRVPTKEYWDGVKANNTQSDTGTWTESSTNYSSARFFGPDLMLPAAGGRDTSDGVLFGRGQAGSYWSSSQDSGSAWDLVFVNGFSFTGYADPLYGYSLRCIAE